MQKVLYSSSKHARSKIIALLCILFTLFFGSNGWSYYCIIPLISLVFMWNSDDVKVLYDPQGCKVPNRKQLNPQGWCMTLGIAVHHEPGAILPLTWVKYFHMHVS